MLSYEFFLTDCLTKIFADGPVDPAENLTSGGASEAADMEILNFYGAIPAFQLVCRCAGDDNPVADAGDGRFTDRTAADCGGADSTTADDGTGCGGPDSTAADGGPDCGGPDPTAAGDGPGCLCDPACGLQPAEFTCRIEGAPGEVRIRLVEQVPSGKPCGDAVDANYLTTEPGLFPDLLKPCPDGRFTPVCGKRRALWIDIPAMRDARPGEYPLTLIAEAAADGHMVSRRFSVLIRQIALPSQGRSFYHTEWFHADCLADYYRTPVFSELHWRAVASQIATAAELGINVILAPVFTPPLDTEVGGERTTVQLTDIFFAHGEYRFGFERLDRFCQICRDAGISRLEIPPLFTQWGAAATPKILVLEDGVPVKKFGWHVPSDSPEYQEFLKAFLPALTEHLPATGYDRDHVFFHISDEPDGGNAENYRAARQAAAGLLEGWTIIDTLSDYRFYEEGLVTHPVVAENHIEPFLRHNVPGLWTYYCCSQTTDVPNRFFAMPSARSRILGVLMYVYHLSGFLHWGYNFYNSGLSRSHIDPFCDTHAGFFFPSGDPFLVYPGTDGQCWSSVRGEVMRQAMEDYRALTALEEAVGRGRVLSLLKEDWEKPLTFTSYPTENAWFFRLTRRIAEEIQRLPANSA